MSDSTPIVPATPLEAPAGEADCPREGLVAFVEALAQWGNVRVAASQAGISRAHLYRIRRADSDFRLLWDAALVLARPQVEEVLADRALNGVQETVFYHGEEVAVRTRYDARLLLAHLGRLDRVEGSGMTWKAVQEFDARVARLLEPPVLLDWDDEDYAEDDADDADGDYGDADYGDGDYGDGDYGDGDYDDGGDTGR